MKLLNMTLRNILALFMVLALVIALLWLVKCQSSSVLSTQAHTPTLIPTETALPMMTNRPMLTDTPSTAPPSESPQPTRHINSSERKGWLTYVDDISGISFQYPPEWEIFEQEIGKSVLFLQDERGHFIYLSLEENPDNLSPREFLIEDRLKNRTTVTRLSLASDVEQFLINEVQGAIHRADDSNIKTVMVIIDQDITIRLSLRIRGAVGGFPLPSNNYAPTEQDMFDLISSLRINP